MNAIAQLLCIERSNHLPQRELLADVSEVQRRSASPKFYRWEPSIIAGNDFSRSGHSGRITVNGLT